MRVFLDANVLFSASNTDSNIARLVARLIAEHQAVTSDLAFEEARRNILSRRAQWHDAFVALMAGIEQVPTIVFPLSVELDEKDQPPLCDAIRGQCDYFATGDRRDFSHLFDHTAQGVTIISLLRLVRLLVGTN